MKSKLVIRAFAVLLLAGSINTAPAQNVSIPDPGLDAAIRQTLAKPTGPLNAQDLLTLTGLFAESRQITNLAGLEGARNLQFLDLSLNTLNDLSIPGSLTNLTTLVLESTSLHSLTLPPGLSQLTELELTGNSLTRFTLPPDATNLVKLNLLGNLLTNVDLPPGLGKLVTLELGLNRLPAFTLPAGYTNLSQLFLDDNQLTTMTVPAEIRNLQFADFGNNGLTNFSLPPGLTNLAVLGLAGNQLTHLTLPSGMTNLVSLFLSDNQLASLTLPADLTHLLQLEVDRNHLTSLALPSGLRNLTALSFTGNQVTNLTIPPELTKLTSLVIDGNPFATLVLSEPLAATNLVGTVATLRNQGVSVFTYPTTATLIRLQSQAGAFQFVIAGPPGVYTILSSTNLTGWSLFGLANNPLGHVVVTDATANLSPQKYYRALLQAPPANMVFIPPNSFTLGSPTNEVGHHTDESPQTIVQLSHGFWISKFLVTQRDYLAVVGDNPSGFPGNLDRPVESVSWFAASNYCALLTQQDQAAGRIPPGSHYRLPTEAEWECAARAGTTTRFNYGDDPNLLSLTNHAWYSANSGFTPQPVGQKDPNAWGLFDMEGNVWEWCQDWYGPYPGGTVINPQGPPSNAIGFKVTRGGAWEASEFDCRSARRSIEGASPFISDFIIGFRVVLAIDP